MQSSTRFALFWAVVALCATGAQAADGDQVAPFFGFMGAMSALVFSCMGAAYGTAKSGVGIASMGVMRPELVMKSIVPVVMAGVLGIYGLINAVIISTNSASTATRSLGSISLAAARRHVSFGDPPRTSSRAPTRSDPGTPPNAQRTSAFAHAHATKQTSLTPPRPVLLLALLQTQFTPRGTPCSRGTRICRRAWRAASPASPPAWPSASRATPACARTRSSPSCSPASCSSSSSPRRSRCTGSSWVSSSRPRGRRR